MNFNMKRAHILSEALPYIRQYHGKTMVIKYGGAALDDLVMRSVVSDLVLLSLVGISVVLVHGGGPEINDMLKKIGKEPRFVDGLRYTDLETMDIVQMVLCGRVGKQLAQLIGEMGGRALSLAGMDGRLLVAKKLLAEDSKKEWGFVGELCEVNPDPVRMALDSGYIPVISTVACGDEPGVCYNINADTAAASLAAALDAEKLILMTDVQGLMRDPSDESSLISEVNLPDIAQLIKEGIVAGGMIPKVDCCVEAIRQGVPRAHILDGRIPHSILIEVLSDHGIGTMILR